MSNTIHNQQLWTFDDGCQSPVLPGTFKQAIESAKTLGDNVDIYAESGECVARIINGKLIGRIDYIDALL